MVGHWEMRNGRAIQNDNPAHIDVDETVRLFLAHGGKAIGQPGAALRAGLEHMKTMAREAGDTLRPDEIDDFARARVASAEELVARFASNFYFGCEADDPQVATAFDRRLVPGGGKLKAMFTSDISHWDVVGMEGVLEEAMSWSSTAGSIWPGSATSPSGISRSCTPAPIPPSSTAPSSPRRCVKQLAAAPRAAARAVTLRYCAAVVRKYSASSARIVHSALPRQAMTRVDMSSP
jgi:hypothetical protein